MGGLAQRHRFVQQRPRVVEPPLCDGDDPQPELCERGEPGAVEPLREVAAFAQVAQGLFVGAGARLQGAGGDERGGGPERLVLRAELLDGERRLPERLVPRSGRIATRSARRPTCSPVSVCRDCSGRCGCSSVKSGRRRPKPPGTCARRFPSYLVSPLLPPRVSPCIGLGLMGCGGAVGGAEADLVAMTFILRPFGQRRPPKRRPRQPAR